MTTRVTLYTELRNSVLCWAVHRFYGSFTALSYIVHRLEVPVWSVPSKRRSMALRSSCVRDEILDVGDALAALGMNPGVLKEVRLEG